MGGAAPRFQCVYVVGIAVKRSQARLFTDTTCRLWESVFRSPSSYTYGKLTCGTYLLTYLLIVLVKLRWCSGARKATIVVTFELFELYFWLELFELYFY